MRERAQTYDRIQLGVYGGLRAGIAIIFDMDGVIIDSNPVHRRCLEHLQPPFRH